MGGGIPGSKFSSYTEVHNNFNSLMGPRDLYLPLCLHFRTLMKGSVIVVMLGRETLKVLDLLERLERKVDLVFIGVSSIKGLSEQGE